MTRVSTIIPVFNGAATVGLAIESALAQDFDNQEIIVVNDGSTDSTRQVLESYGSRIVVIQQKNQGQPVARNLAIQHAASEYMAFLDADDVWLPGRLSKTVAALERNPAAPLVFSDYIRVDQAGITVDFSTVPSSLAHPPTMDEILTHWWPIAPTTVTMRRSIWERCGGFAPAAKGFEDLYLFVLARECGQFEYLAEPLAKFRVANGELGPDKWSPDVFIRLIRERYGARAHGLLIEVRNTYAGAFVCKALQAMEQGNRKEALRCWRRAVHFDPLAPFKAAYPGRLIHRRNVRRVAKMLWSKHMAELQ